MGRMTKPPAPMKDHSTERRRLLLRQHVNGTLFETVKAQCELINTVGLMHYVCQKYYKYVF